MIVNDESNQAPKLTVTLDSFVRRVGNVVAYLSLVLIVAILIQVILRYFFGKGFVALEELQWHLYSVGFLFGLSYCVVVDAHTRLDLLHRKLSLRTKELFEFFGLLFLVMPLIVCLFIHSLGFVESAWRVGEASPSPLGLPWRWAIKSMIPISMFLLGVASIARMIRAAVIGFRKS